MIDTHAHPALIPPYSIDPIRLACPSMCRIFRPEPRDRPNPAPSSFAGIPHVSGFVADRRTEVLRLNRTLAAENDVSDGFDAGYLGVADQLRVECG